MTYYHTAIISPGLIKSKSRRCHRRLLQRGAPIGGALYVCSPLINKIITQVMTYYNRQLSTLEGRPTVLSRLRRMAISSGRRNQVSAILMPRLYLTSKARTRRSEMDNSEAACLVLIRVLRSIMGWCAGSDHLPGEG